MSVKTRSFLALMVASMIILLGFMPMAYAENGTNVATPTTPFTPVPINRAPTDRDKPAPGEAEIDGFRVSQVTTKSSMDIYTSPRTNSSKMLSIKNGDVLLLIGAPVDDWQLVKVGKEYGYVRASHLNNTTQIVVPKDAVIATVTVSANIRINADSKSTIYGVGRAGTSIAILGEEGAYYKVRFMTKSGVKTGYILKKYVEIE